MLPPTMFRPMPHNSSHQQLYITNTIHFSTLVCITSSLGQCVSLISQLSIDMIILAQQMSSYSSKLTYKWQWTASNLSGQWRLAAVPAEQAWYHFIFKDGDVYFLYFLFSIIRNWINPGNKKKEEQENTL